MSLQFYYVIAKLVVLNIYQPVTMDGEWIFPPLMDVWNLDCELAVPFIWQQRILIYIMNFHELIRN
jgi:hypothetical protein